MIRLNIIVLAILINLSCFGQENIDKLKLSDLHFESIFGYNKNDSSINYCILGQGFFRAPCSENSDSVINEWISQHNNAEVIPVSSFSPVMQNDPDSKMIYCWLVDNGDTLNINLIRQGCFPGGTMQRPQTWKELSRYEKKLHKGAVGDKLNVKVFISKSEYKSFIDRVIKAEEFAEKNRLGIWNKID